MSFVILDAPPQRTARSPLARQISYAHAGQSHPARAFIRSVETLTGRPALLRRLDGIEADLANGRDLWRALMQRFGLRIEVLRGSLEAIPAEGPLVLVANHPFGILDGLVMAHLLSALRGDFRILAHQVFARAEAVNRVILPVDFSGTPEAQSANLRMRAEAIRHLRGGGAVGIFPGGTVSTAARPFESAMDPVWRAFTARMIERSGATVVPIWFEGQNSRLFQLSSHLSQTLRVSLLMREFATRLDRPVALAVGAPITAETLRQQGSDGKQMMDFLRRKTYDLSPKPLDPTRLGHEFEENYRR